MPKSIGRRGYNAYLRKAKKRFGITHAQARKMYRLQRDHGGEPINSRAIDLHPRLAKRFADAAIKPERKKRKLRAAGSGTQAALKSTGGPATPSPGRPAAPPRRVRTVEEWERLYDDYGDTEHLVLNAGVDTGKGKGKK